MSKIVVNSRNVAMIWLTALLICYMTPSIEGAHLYERYRNEICKDAQTGRELFVGDVFTRPGQCIRVQCLGTLELWEDNCQVPKSLKGDCTPEPAANKFLDYPKCCPLYVCKVKDESNPNGHVHQINTYDHYGNLRRSYLTELIVINDIGNNIGGEAPTPRRQYQI